MYLSPRQKAKIRELIKRAKKHGKRAKEIGEEIRRDLEHAKRPI
jgi:hypothetical protein